MPLKYTCYVPNEWANNSKAALKKTITKTACKQLVENGNIEGATMSLQNVTAKLVNYNYQPWMRKTGDDKNYPDPKQYFGMRMDCIYCTASKVSFQFLDLTKSQKP